MGKKRKIFGVIAAQVADIEQKQILKSLIAEAQSMDIDVVIFSNIYNPVETNPSLVCENEIYDLILSPELDGLILISEAIVNKDLQKRLRGILLQQAHLPIVVVGTKLPNFDLPNFSYLNTSDENDMEDITDHLIEEHGFRSIDMLSGHQELAVSHQRVQGYRRSLEKHGIAFDPGKVHFGDFWMTAGTELATQYLTGALPFPEAILCANDYMAYGLMDELLAHGVSIPEQVTVIGYEYVRERLYHAPILTTYQRNRQSLGREAVLQLSARCNGEAHALPTPPKGRLIRGSSCACGFEQAQYNAELQRARDERFYDFLNLYCQLDHQLTECKTMRDFIACCESFHYLVRDVQEIHLCLYDNWTEDGAPCEQMTGYTMREIRRKSTHFHMLAFSEILRQSDHAAAYYYSPVFFSEQTLGYLVLRYDKPDTYDYIFRNWLKSVSNGLAFLRMKNNIQYLMECQNLSETQDSLTGLFNEQGFRQLYSAKSKEPATMPAFCVILKTQLFHDELSVEQKKAEVAATLEAAAVMERLCGKNACGRIGNQVFAGLCAAKPSEDAALLTDRLETDLIHQSTYLKSFGLDSYAVLVLPFDPTLPDAALLDAAREQIEGKRRALLERQSLPYYPRLLQIRNQIYANPQEPHDLDELCKECMLSLGHFRSLYRSVFGVTLHQDCINSRISLAKYLLASTNTGLSAIAEACGYEDKKYFLRQFQKCTGLTPNQYRHTV